MVVLAAVTASPAVAQPVPTVTVAGPLSVQRGQTAEFTLAGASLGGVSSVEVAEAQGVVATLVKPEKPAGGQATVRLVAAADATPGPRELRLLSPTGVSNPVTIQIEQFPLLAESEPNNLPEQASGVALPAVLVGRIGSGGDADVYRFTAAKGEHLVFDVQAARLGSPLDAQIVVSDPGGREVASNNDTHGADPFVAFDVPADGTYLLEIRDLQYRGGDDYAYRVEAGPIPYAEALVPTSGQRGRAVEVTALGHNLGDAAKFTLDLSYAQPGRVQVRATTPLGVSNALPFDVDEAAAAVEAEPNGAPDKANAVALPAEVTGRIERGDDEDFFRFTLEQKQMVNLEVTAGRLGSPVDALLTLRTKDGTVIESNDDAAGADARITRDLDPGEYVVSVRDLVYAGGPDSVYRLTLEPTVAPPQDFTVRFLPDAPRVFRGGNVALWCEVARVNGYAGQVTVTVEDLPGGVTAAPTVLGPASSGILTISAAPGANVGPFPIRLKASGVVGNRVVTRYADPELGGRPLRQAFLTVLDGAPFTLETVSQIDPARLQQLAGELSTLAAKIDAPDPRLDAAQAEWEKSISAATPWTPLEVTSATSSGGATLAKQPDGSVLASGPTPERDTYTIAATTDVKGVTAVRLELLTDPSLPNAGPGRAPNGNLVLTRLLVTAAPKATPAAATKVTLARPRASFEQAGYPAAHAVDNEDPADRTGWAIAPEMGKSQSAVFFTTAPVGGDGGTVFNVVLDHAYGTNHTIGKFRLSVTTDPAAADAPPVPMPVLAAVKVPADKRDVGQKQLLADYYRSIDPVLTADRVRLQGLRNAVAPHAEIARLESLLNAQTPHLDAELAAWERVTSNGATWTPLTFTGTASAGGATLTAEPDNSICAGGKSPPVDTYTLTAVSPVAGITALRLEVLPDPRLPGNGPGRGTGGNFVLTRLQLKAGPKGVPVDQATNVELHSPDATVEQPGLPPAGTLDERNDTGWAVAPHFGRPATATFYTRAQVGGGPENVLTLVLDQQSPFPQHTIGRFRAWVTNALDPRQAPSVPESVLAILRTPAASRNEAQKAALAAYYRSVAPSLDPVRQHVAELRSRVGPATPVAARGAAGGIPVIVNRLNGFTGDVRVTLEGFVTGRENGLPKATARSIKFEPATVNAGNTFGTLAFNVDPASEVGTRVVVLRAEAKVGNDTIVQYSQAFPMTVN